MSACLNTQERPAARTIRAGQQDSENLMIEEYAAHTTSPRGRHTPGELLICDTYSWCAGHKQGGDWNPDLNVKIREHQIPLSALSRGHLGRGTAEFVLVETVSLVDSHVQMEDPCIAIGGEMLSVEDAAQFAHALLANLVEIREIAAEAIDGSE